MLTRLAVAAAGIIILVGLFFVLRPASTATGPQAFEFNVSIANVKMTPSQFTVRQDDKVTLRLSSDTPVNLHLHGYDLEKEIAPGATETISFDATLTGQFEIEDELTTTPLGKLVVEPR